MSGQVPVQVRSGVDPTQSVLLRDKIMIATLLVPFVDRTIRTAGMYALHHTLPDQSVVVTIEHMKRAMKYQFLHPDGAAARIKQDMIAFLQYIQGSAVDEYGDAQAEEESPDADHNCAVPEFSAATQQVIGQYYAPIEQAVLAQGGGGSSGRTAAAVIMQAVMGGVQHDDADDNDREAEERANADADDNDREEEEHEEEEEAPVSCACQQCRSMDEIASQWPNWEPTEEWQVPLYGALQKAFSKYE